MPEAKPTTYVHNTPATAYNHIPKGWKETHLQANTPPDGYFWITNNQSYFSGKRKYALVKKPVKKPLHQTAVPNHNKRLDDRRGALDPGKRVSRTGKTYYEYRVNRSDTINELVEYNKSGIKKIIASKEQDLKLIPKEMAKIKEEDKKNTAIWRNATLRMDKLEKQRKKSTIKNKARLSIGITGCKKQIEKCKAENTKIQNKLKKCLDKQKELKDDIFRLKRRL